ncbi:Scr1 family TA system antitoxin-like transcriptional regulator [Streptomyces niveus]|uniref:Scr1 family TA system antitoxin-like transcriptional regulator n=1 Tax=Streptomyces niveus TaxID=193462 RepID=UPI0036CF9C98
MRGDPRRTAADAYPGCGALVVGAYLLALRRGHRMSDHDAALMIRRHPQALHRLESGRTPLRGEVPAQVATLLRGYGLVDDQAIEAVLGLAPRVTSTQPHLCNDSGIGVRDRLAACWCVATATRVYTDGWLPPAVQTPAYALAYATFHGSRERYGPGSFRFPEPTRQRRLTLLMSQAVLHPPAVAPSVMAAQLDHLHRLAVAGSLIVRIVPPGRPPPYAGKPMTELVLNHCHLYARQTLTATHHSVAYSDGQGEGTERAMFEMLEEITDESEAIGAMLAAARRMEIAGKPTVGTAGQRAPGRALAARSKGTGVTAPAGWRVTGMYLRALRAEKGLIQASAARLIGCSASFLSNLENGKVQPQQDTLTRLLREYGVVATREIESVVRFACEADLGDQHDSGPGSADRLAVCWRAADAAVVHTDGWLPRPLQTPAYAKVFDAIHGFTPRSGRPGSSDLSPPRGLRLTLIIGEAVLRRPTGGAEVMAAQLAHLQDLVDADRLTVRALPFDSGLLPGRRTTELLLRDGLLYAMEEPGGVTYRTDERPALRLDRLQQAALTPEATAAQMDVARRTTFAPGRSA